MMAESQDSLAEEGIFLDCTTSLPLDNFAKENGSQDFELVDSSQEFLTQNICQDDRLQDTFLECKHSQKKKTAEEMFHKKNCGNAINCIHFSTQNVGILLQTETHHLQKRKLESTSEQEEQEYKKPRTYKKSSDFNDLILGLPEYDREKQLVSKNIRPDKLVKSPDIKNSEDFQQNRTNVPEGEVHSVLFNKADFDNQVPLSKSEIQNLPVGRKYTIVGEAETDHVCNGKKDDGSGIGSSQIQGVIEISDDKIKEITAQSMHFADDNMSTCTEGKTKPDFIYSEKNEKKTETSSIEVEMSSKLHTSIEVVFEHSPNKRLKPCNREMEEIVLLDSSREDSKTGKLSLESQNFDISKSNIEVTNPSHSNQVSTIVSQEAIDFDTLRSPSKLNRIISDPRLQIKIPANPFEGNSDISNMLARLTKEQEILSVSKNIKFPESCASDSDNSLSENKDLFDAEAVKIKRLDREIVISIKVKCTLKIDETTKEIYHKEITGCTCNDNIAQHSEKLIDSSGILGDVSDNKDQSPSSVISNPLLFKLNPRHSVVSTISSSSSGSSIAAVKMLNKDNLSVSQKSNELKKIFKNPEDKMNFEAFEKFSNEWKNSRLLLNVVKDSLDQASVMSAVTDMMEEPLGNLRSSTPEVNEPKKIAKISSKQTKKTKIKKNGTTISSTGKEFGFIKKKTNFDNSETIMDSKSSSVVDDFSNQVEFDLYGLLGETVFAKWADNKYYPGKVVRINQARKKYKVKFCDGFEKDILPDFIAPVQENMNGYAIETLSGDFEIPGVIVGAIEKNKKMFYILDTVEGHIQKQIEDLHMTAEQAKILKQDSVPKYVSVPPTPQHLSHIVLENLVTGNRRSKRTGTPRSKKSLIYNTDPCDGWQPSCSGTQNMSVASSTEQSESDGNQTNDNDRVLGVQSEIIGTSTYENKDPGKRIKGRQKKDSKKLIEELGPIPVNGSKIFSNLSFIISCTSKFDRKTFESISEDTEYEDESEWQKYPFNREYLIKQITHGGGNFYENFEDIPKMDYPQTMHITNLPNRSKTSLLCLSVGIRSFKHNWIILMCTGNHVRPESEELPAGYSICEKKYVESYARISRQPLKGHVIAIPSECGEEFTCFWKTISENSGATIMTLDKPGQLLDVTFAIIANEICPSWVVDEAKKSKTRIYSTMWITQCLIEGKLIDDDDVNEFNVFC